MAQKTIEAQLLAAGRQLADRTPGTSGNLSCLLDDRQAFVVSPSGLSYQELGEADFVTLDIGTGAIVKGQRVPSTEWRLHQAIYQRRPDVRAIVHVHSFYATVLSTLNRPVKAVHYQLSWVGDEVAVAEYATYGTVELAQNAASALGQSGAVLLKNHGLVTVADTLERAMTFAKDVEWVAALYVTGLQIGEPNVLSAEQLAQARVQFRRYGQPEQ